jgi:hypothetical protein
MVRHRASCEVLRTETTIHGKLDLLLRKRFRARNEFASSLGIKIASLPTRGTNKARTVCSSIFGLLGRDLRYQLGNLAGRRRDESDKL